MTKEERIQQTEDKLLEMITEMDKLVSFLLRLSNDDDDDNEEEYYEKIIQVLKTKSEHFKFINDAGLESAGLLSYYDYGLKWLEYIRLLEFDSYNGSAMDIHECITKIISLDIDIARLIHLTEVIK